MNASAPFKEARQRLLYLVQQQADSREDTTVILDILVEHSSLAFDDECLPLVALLKLQASLHSIIQVLQLNPGALQQPSGRDNRLPLHVACAAGGLDSGKVIPYLVQQYPAAVATQDANGNLPIHHAMQHEYRRVSLDTIQCLTSAYPESVTHKNHNGETCLTYAVGNGYSTEVLEYLMATLPCKSKPILDFIFWSRTPLDLPRCQLMTKLLPKLRSLTCRPSQWSWDGMVHLLTCLQEQPCVVKHLQTLSLEGVPRAFFTVNTRVRRELQQLVILLQEQHGHDGSDSTTEHQIKLQIKNTWYDKNRKSDRECLEILGGIFQGHSQHHQKQQHHLQVSISLHAFQLYRRDLESLLENIQQTTELSFTSCTIFEDSSSRIVNESGQGTLPGPPLQPMPFLRRLELVHCRMSLSNLESLLKRFQDNTARLELVKLVFREHENFGGNLDITPFVQTLLYCPDTRLKSFTIDGLRVDPDLLVDYAANSRDRRTTACIQYSQHGQLWTDDANSPGRCHKCSSH